MYFLAASVMSVCRALIKTVVPSLCLPGVLSFPASGSLLSDGFSPVSLLLLTLLCISEGQNLQDCDYCINYDIHWNPVRIIQRFGRIDRIGSQNAVIQLVNFWPDLDLDEYINLDRKSVV